MQDYMAPEVLRCPQKHKPNDNKVTTAAPSRTSLRMWLGLHMLNS
jgi:hypothetical protein